MWWSFYSFFWRLFWNKQKWLSKITCFNVLTHSSQCTLSLTPEILTIFCCFQEVEKGCIENEWVKKLKLYTKLFPERVRWTLDHLFTTTICKRIFTTDTLHWTNASSLKSISGVTLSENVVGWGTACMIVWLSFFLFSQ